MHLHSMHLSPENETKHQEVTESDGEERQTDRPRFGDNNAMALKWRRWRRGRGYV